MPFERKMDGKLVLSIIAAGIMSFVGVVVETSMNIAFPALMKEFAVGTGTVQWITTGYLLVLAVVIPSSSFLKTRFRAKTLFLFAIITFMIGTILGIVAPAFWVLLLGRLIQGIGTGIALPLMFNIVLEQAPFEKMGLLMGIATMVTALAPAVGPSYGGMIISSFGWRMIFVTLLPLLAIAMVVGIFSIRQASETRKVPYDLLGNALLAVCFVCFILGLNQGSALLILASVVLGFLYVWHARKSPQPLIRIDIFRVRKFDFSLVSMILIQMITLGIGFIIPNYAQLSREASAFAAGCILLPGCIIGAVIIPFSGRLLDRKGAALPIRTGTICVLAALILLALLFRSVSLTVMACIYCIYTIGQSLSSGNVMTNGLKALPEELNGDGNAAFNTLQQLAGAVGTAVASAIMASAQAASPDLAATTQTGAGYGFIAFVIAAAAFVICGFLATMKK